MSDDAAFIANLIDSALGRGASQRYPQLVKDVTQAARSPLASTRVRDLIFNFKPVPAWELWEQLRTPPDYKPRKEKTHDAG